MNSPLPHMHLYGSSCLYQDQIYSSSPSHAMDTQGIFVRVERDGIISHRVVGALLIIQIKQQVALRVIWKVDTSNLAWRFIIARTAKPPMCRHSHPDSHKGWIPLLVNGDGLGDIRRHGLLETEESGRGVIYEDGRLWDDSQKKLPYIHFGQYNHNGFIPNFSELDNLVESILVKNKHNHVVVDGFSFHNHYSDWCKTYFRFFTKLTAKRAKQRVSKQTP